MTGKSIYDHPTLGEIDVVFSSRARRISIRINSSARCTLTIPLWSSREEALTFLGSKVEWIERTRERTRKRHPEQLIDMPYSTRRHSLRLTPVSRKSVAAKVKDGVIEVQYPLEIRYDTPEVQKIIKRGIEEAWRAEAAEILPERVRGYASKFGMKVGEVTVRNSRTRWGSCSSRNDISLSLHLMKLPDELIDYIIIHELCHIRHKNHGPRFYKLLDSLCDGRHEELRKKLKAYSTRW